MARTTLKEAAQVLLDDIEGLGPLERVGQINPVAVENLRGAIRSERRTGKRESR